MGFTAPPPPPFATPLRQIIVKNGRKGITFICKHNRARRKRISLEFEIISGVIVTKAP
jgi:hypothetical protein